MAGRDLSMPRPRLAAYVLIELSGSMAGSPMPALSHDLRLLRDESPGDGSAAAPRKSRPVAPAGGMSSEAGDNAPNTW